MDEDLKEGPLQAQAQVQIPATMQPPQPVEALFREHHDRVFRVAYRVTGNADDAEDVLQTIFLRLVRRETEPDLRPSPGSYLHRAAVNAALDVVRARGTSRAVPLDAAAELRGTPDDEPDLRYDETALRAELRAALAKLSPRAAEMFVLRYFEGLDTAEVARAIGTSRGVVAVTLFRTRNRLKKELATFVGETR